MILTPNRKMSGCNEHFPCPASNACGGSSLRRKRFVSLRGFGTGRTHVPFLSKCSMEKRISAERIVSLEPGEVFVFGSNLEGWHGGGAARLAHRAFDAEWGVGAGPTGRCYAIPTMQGGVESIRPYVEAFLTYARQHAESRFLVTEIGCGIAGFTPQQIAPLFRDALPLPNVFLPRRFLAVLEA